MSGQSLAKGLKLAVISGCPRTTCGMGWASKWIPWIPHQCSLSGLALLLELILLNSAHLKYGPIALYPWVLLNACYFILISILECHRFGVGNLAPANAKVQGPAPGTAKASFHQHPGGLGASIAG